MADEIAYEVLAVEGADMTVRYTMDPHVLEIRIPIPSGLQPEAHISAYAPRVLLMGMGNADTAALVGLTGTVDLNPTPPAPPAP